MKREATLTDKLRGAAALWPGETTEEQRWGGSGVPDPPRQGGSRGKGERPRNGQNLEKRRDTHPADGRVKVRTGQGWAVEE